MSVRTKMKQMMIIKALPFSEMLTMNLPYSVRMQTKVRTTSSTAVFQPSLSMTSALLWSHPASQKARTRIHSLATRFRLESRLDTQARYFNSVSVMQLPVKGVSWQVEPKRQTVSYQAGAERQRSNRYI